MKLTNKILLIIASLIFAIATITSVIIVANIEIAVTPYIDGRIEKELPNHSFSEIIISSGFRVNIIQSDSFAVVVRGADNLVNNYLNIEQKKEKLIFHVKPGIKYYSLHVTVDISMPVVERIVIEEPEFEYQAFWTSLNLSNFVLNDLDINLATDGKLYSVNCEINNLKVKCSQFASATFDSCKINNVEYSLKDYSFARIRDVLENITGELEDKSIISYSKLEGESVILQSKELIELYPNYKDNSTGLTWGSTMEEVEQIIKNNFGSKINKESFWYKNRHEPFYPMMSNLLFEGGSYCGIAIENINLAFYQNSLYGVVILLKNNSNSLEENHKILLKKLNENYSSVEFSESNNKTTWKAKNDNGEYDATGTVFNDKGLYLYINSEKLTNIMRNELDIKNEKNKHLFNYRKRQKTRYKNPIENFLEYSLK